MFRTHLFLRRSPCTGRGLVPALHTFICLRTPVPEGVFLGLRDWRANSFFERHGFISDLARGPFLSYSFLHMQKCLRNARKYVRPSERVPPANLLKSFHRCSQMDVFRPWNKWALSSCDGSNTLLSQQCFRTCQLSTNIRSHKWPSKSLSLQPQSWQKKPTLKFFATAFAACSLYSLHSPFSISPRCKS